MEFSSQQQTSARNGGVGEGGGLQIKLHFSPTLLPTIVKME